MELPIIFLYVIASGVATHYGHPGMMAYAASYHQVPYREETQVVALKEDYLGEIVYLYFPDLREWTGPYIVGDLANQSDWRYLDKIDFAVDLSYDEAKRLNTIGHPTSVIVYLFRGRGSDYSIFGVQLEELGSYWFPGHTAKIGRLGGDTRF
ncbi:MAG: hypothetical protein ABIH46_08910 [Chloroflexota bacterium]